MSATVTATNASYDFVDDRLGSSNFVKRSINKVFPDHWSFMIGEIALYSFVILLLTGTYLTLFYDASLKEVVYNGSYIPLKGVPVSAAYESTVRLSFDVRGGLLMRQMHHWAALIFVASISVHLLRVFFTGAFRKPREINWLIGVGLLVLALLEGFAGYSLPDDLLSGTGLRIAEAIMQSIPVVGTWVAFLLFGGEYPGEVILGRLYVAHILLLPGVILALITAHMMILWHQKHTQFRGPGRTEDNVVGHKLYPGYAANGGGFFFLVFGVMALLGGLVQINPIWLYGPYQPDVVSAGSQPDWYIGWLDGALRLMPGLEYSALGYTFSLNLFLPSVVIPSLVFLGLAIYPFLEARFSGDHEYHNLLDRPRDNARRTALGAMALTFYTILWIVGGNDAVATIFNLSINAITYTGRVLVIVAPPLAYWITYRWCLNLQKKDRDTYDHGVETGLIRRLPSGEVIEVHAPVKLPAGSPALAGGAHGPAELEGGHADNGNGHKPSVLATDGRAVTGFFVEDSSST